MTLDARTRVLLVLALSIGVALVDGPAPLAVLGLLVAAAVARARPARRVLLLLGVLWATMAWATVLSQSLFYSQWPRTPWWTLGPLTVWREGASYGLVQSLRYGVLLGGGLALVSSTPPDRLLSAMAALRVPYVPAFLAATALRYVPWVAQEVLAVRAARSARGRPMWRRGPVAWVRQELALLVPVAARALRRAHGLAETLDTRGFDVARPPTPAPSAWPRIDLAILAAVSALLVATGSSRLLFALYVADVWWTPALRPLYALVRRWL